MKGPDLKKILASKVFFKLLEKASIVVTKNRKVSKVAAKAIEKVMKTGSITVLGISIVKQLRLLSMMTYYYGKGMYRNVTQKSIVIIIAVLLYFLMPLDLMPDFIPFLGYLDDITLIGWLFSTLGKEIIQFEDWYEEFKKAETISFEEINKG